MNGYTDIIIGLFPAQKNNGLERRKIVQTQFLHFFSLEEHGEAEFDALQEPPAGLLLREYVHTLNETL